jgi:hypothetical protein
MEGEGPLCILPASLQWVLILVVIGALIDFAPVSKARLTALAGASWRPYGYSPATGSMGR